METFEPVDLRRRWLAITAGTVVAQFAYWPVVGSIAARASESTAVAPELLAVGLGVVPFAFLALAFFSRHPRFPMATLKALGLFILVGAPLIVLVNVVVGMAVGLAAGGVVALQREEEVHLPRWRWIAVAATAAYLLAIYYVAVEFALVSGAVLPFAVHGLVDQAAETRPAS